MSHYGPTGTKLGLLAFAVWAAAGLTLLGPALAQDAPGDARLDALFRTQSFLCQLGNDVLVATLRETDAGDLEALGDLAAWQVTESDSRIALSHGDAFLQLDGANSLAVFEGELVQGTCLDVSYKVLELVSEALGGDPGDIIASLETSLIGRAQVAEEQLRALEAEVATLRRSQTSCGPQAAQLLEWIARDLTRLGAAEIPDGERQAVVETMGTRVASLRRLCGSE